MLTEYLIGYLGPKYFEFYQNFLKHHFGENIAANEKQKVVEDTIELIKGIYSEEYYSNHLGDIIFEEVLGREIENLLKPYSSISDDFLKDELDFSTLPDDFRDQLVNCLIKSLANSKFFENKLVQNTIANDVSELKRMVQQLLLNKTDNNLNKLGVTLPVPKLYEFRGKYIRRSISASPIVENNHWGLDYILNLDFAEFEEFGFNSESKVENTLENLVRSGKDKRIVLLSSAGSGKSTEIEFLANILSRPDSGFYPIKIHLNIIEIESIEDLLELEINEWKKIPQELLVVILDGLDEVHSDKIDFVFKKIEKFAIQYNSCRIIVSCRNNFYTPEMEGEDNGSIKGFKSFYLDGISAFDIRRYIHTELTSKAETFLKGIKKKHNPALLQNPFYLIRIVDLFKTEQKLPNTIADLFELIIEMKIEHDIRHFDNNGKKISLHQPEILKAAEKIAVLAESLGRNFITDKEIYEVVKNVSTIEFLNHSFLLVKNNRQSKQFEHNNFQEYFAAKILSRQDIEIVKKWISFGPSYRKLKPNWINTTSFLFSILSSHESKFKELLTWLINNEPNALIRFEFDKIDLKIREKIFETIIENSINKCLGLRVENFSIEELAKFSGGSKRITKFLISVLESSEYKIHISDMIELLSYLGKIYVSEEYLYGVFSRILEKYESDYSIIYQLLKAVSRLELFEYNFTSYLVNRLGKSKSSHKRIGLFQVIFNSPDTEKLILEFLRNLEPTSIKGLSSSVNEDDEPIMFGENLYLGKCLQKVESVKGLFELVGYLKVDRHGHVFEKDDRTVDIIVSNIIRSDELSPDFYELMLDWFEYADRRRDTHAISILKSYFERTNNVLRAFKDLYNKVGVNKMADWAACKMADKSCVDFLLSEYEVGNLSEDGMIIYRNGMKHNNPDVHEYFYDIVNKRTNNKFLYQPARNFEEERIKLLKADLNLLFNKTLFEEKVREVFTRATGDLTSEYLWDIRKSKFEDSELEENIVINALRELADDLQCINMASVEARILEDSSWNWFKLYHLNRFVEQNVELLDTVHIEWITKWCYEEVKTADFKTAISYNDNNTVTYRYKEVYLFNFFVNLKLEYPTNIVLDMLEYPWIGDTSGYNENNSINYIISQLEFSDFTKRVIFNLHRKTFNRQVLLNHINFIDNYSIVAAKTMLIDLIKNDTLQDWDKKRVLEIYARLGGDINRLEELLVLVNFNEDWNWELFKLLSIIDSEAGLLELKNTEATKENWVQISNGLLKFKDVGGIDIIIRSLIKYKTVPYDYEIPIIEICKFEFTLVWEKLFRILEIIYLGDFRSGKHNRVDEQVFRCLGEYLLEDDSFIEVYNKIKECIEVKVSNSDSKGDLNFYLARMERSYYTKKTEKIDFHEIILNINSLR